MKKQQQEDYGLGLQESYDRWAHLYEYGGSDPFWEDGVNLNLVRNHILYYRQKLEENPTLFGYPEVYYKEIPPKVDSKYMARPDEIRTNAKAALVKYKADPNYQYILEHYNDFTPKTRKNLCLDNVIGYATGLEHYIKEDKLVDMRRHENYKSYLQSFEDCVRKMQNTPPEPVQLAFNSLFNNDTNNLDDSDFDENDFDDSLDGFDDMNGDYYELENDNETQSKSDFSM